METERTGFVSAGNQVGLGSFPAELALKLAWGQLMWHMGGETGRWQCYPVCLGKP